MPYHAGMSIDDNLDQQPWWRFAYLVAGALAGLLALGAVIVGLIAVVSGFFVDENRPPAPVFLDLRSPPGQPSPYAPVPWPTHPGREMWGSQRQGQGDGTGGGAAAPARPTGLSVEELRATWESGERILLPNPQGECALGGQDATRSIEALEHCIARQAAR